MSVEDDIAGRIPERVQDILSWICGLAFILFFIWGLWEDKDQK